MTMTNMKLSKKESTKEISPVSVSKPNYPWGLRVTLNRDALKKLKINASEFEKDQEVTLICKARVSRISISTDDYADAESVDLQIEKMKINPDAKEEDELDWDTDNKKAEKILFGKRIM